MGSASAIAKSVTSLKTERARCSGVLCRARVLLASDQVTDPATGLLGVHGDPAIRDVDTGNRGGDFPVRTLDREDA